MKDRKNNFLEKISFFLAFLVALIIFFWSNIEGFPGPEAGFLSLPTLYHFGIFALFSAFIFLSFFSNFRTGIIFLIFFFVFLYALLDEIHQIFIPGRSCNIHDITIDFLGVICGFLFIGFWKIFEK